MSQIMISKNNFCMSKCSLFLVDEDLFLNFSSTSYSLATGIKTKLLKGGAKDATRMARSTQEHGIAFFHRIQLMHSSIFLKILRMWFTNYSIWNICGETFWTCNMMSSFSSAQEQEQGSKFTASHSHLPTNPKVRL